LFTKISIGPNCFSADAVLAPRRQNDARPGRGQHAGKPRPEARTGARDERNPPRNALDHALILMRAC
jgi:hypothetical protein